MKSLKQTGLEQQVFTTECAASWFFNTAKAAQSDAPGLPGAVIASVEGNFMERAERIAAALRTSGADVAFYHANLNEQITARVAAFRPVPIQINVAHPTEMDAVLFDGIST